MVCINNVLIAEIRLEEIITNCMDTEELRGLIHKQIHKRLQNPTYHLRHSAAPSATPENICFLPALSHWVLSTFPCKTRYRWTNSA